MQHLPRDQQHNVFLYALTLKTSTGQSFVWGSAHPEGITTHCSTLGRHSIAQSAARCSCHSCSKVSSYQVSYSLSILKVYAQQRLLIDSKSDLIIITWLCSSVISFDSWDNSSPATSASLHHLKYKYPAVKASGWLCCWLCPHPALHCLQHCSLPQTSVTKLSKFEYENYENSTSSYFFQHKGLKSIALVLTHWLQLCPSAASHWPIKNAHNASTYEYKINTKISIESMCQNISNCTTYP